MIGVHQESLLFCFLKRLFKFYTHPLSVWRLTSVLEEDCFLSKTFVFYRCYSYCNFARIPILSLYAFIPVEHENIFFSSVHSEWSCIAYLLVDLIFFNWRKILLEKFTHQLWFILGVISANIFVIFANLSCKKCVKTRKDEADSTASPIFNLILMLRPFHGNICPLFSFYIAKKIV